MELSNSLEDFLSDSPATGGEKILTENQRAIRDVALESIATNPIDYRIRQLSYSSLTLLHTCPRKYQLYKHQTKGGSPESEESTITFAFGHVVGAFIQDILSGIPRERVILNMFLGWHAPLFAENTKKQKSFWDTMIALDRFISLQASGFLEEYELVIYNGKPATELSFCITLPDGFRLRGFVDAVLRNKNSGEIMVLECKTTGNNVNPTVYKNSAQAIGYSIVLDALFPELSSYEVLYLVYKTTDQTYTPIPFTKSYAMRARWIKELLMDVERIKMYAAEDMFPMHGESCYSYWRDCEYLNICTLSDHHILPAFDPDKHIDLTEYQINISLLDLVQAQLEKTVVPFDAGEFSGEML
jgi:hypothetical protein